VVFVNFSENESFSFLPKKVEFFGHFFGPLFGRDFWRK
jgi:hypothetical protein